MKEYKPIKVDISAEMIEKAKLRDKGAYNNRSFMNGHGNLVGFLGEYITLAYRPDFQLINNFNYDLLFKDYRIDVKTKHQSVPQDPMGYYEASVDVNSLHQELDFYIFCRIFKKSDNEFPYGWILGAISKDDFFKYARKLKKGDADGDNGYKVRQDCYNIRYDQLKQIKKHNERKN